MITLLIIPILILTLLILKQHIHILPIDTFAIEKYYSITKRKEVFRISKPNKIFFSISNDSAIKYITIPSFTQKLCCDGILRDFAKCDINIQYNMEIVNDQNKLKGIYYWFPYTTKCKNICLVDKNLNMHFTGLTREFLSHYSSSEINTFASLEEFKDKLIKMLENEYAAFIKISIFSVRINFDFPITYADKRTPAEMNIESLAEANYNMQQINQILKANDEGIVLSHISPIVPDRIIRKIRESYDSNKEKLDKFIVQLSIKTKTQEEIDNICKQIANL